MERWWKIVLLGASCAALSATLGCERPLGGDSSRLIIQTPNSLGKVGALAALPANRKVCYAVNVTETGKTKNISDCSPTTEILAGFVEPGQELIAKEVPRGTGRKVELYIYLLPEFQNTPCPPLGKTIPAQYIKDTYHVATALNVNVNADLVPVPMTMNFQNVANHLGVTHSLPAACTNGSQNPPAFGTTSSAGEATGIGMKMYGRVGRPQDGKELTGSGIKLIVRE